MPELTPEQVEMILPMMGFSIVLNLLLVGLLLIRPFYRAVLREIQQYWIGVRLLRREE